MTKDVTGWKKKYYHEIMQTDSTPFALTFLQIRDARRLQERSRIRDYFCKISPCLQEATSGLWTRRSKSPSQVAMSQRIISVQSLNVFDIRYCPFFLSSCFSDKCGTKEQGYLAVFCVSEIVSESGSYSQRRRRSTRKHRGKIWCNGILLHILQLVL